MDAIQIIRRDHREVEELFRRIQRAGEGAVRTKAALARELVRALSVHAAIEEELVYPALREAGAGGVLEALEEHHAVKLLLAELDALGPRAPRFDAKVAVIAENVRHHVAEEERELLPRLRKALDARQRAELGAALEAARAASPTRPHPEAPDEPPGIFVAGAATALSDRVRDAAREATLALRAAVERAWREASRTLQGLFGRAQGRGRRVVADLGDRTVSAMEQAGARAPIALLSAGERGRDAARSAGAGAARAAKAARASGRRVSRSAKRAPGRAAAQARSAARAATRGFTGEPGSVH